jgi:hypothetical protein
VHGGEAGEHLHLVVADGEDGDAVPFEVGQIALQLDQLRFAERSPQGTSVENDQALAPDPGLLKMNSSAVLVWQHDVGKALPDARPSEVVPLRGSLSSGILATHPPVPSGSYLTVQ